MFITLLPSCQSVRVHLPPVDFPEFPVMSDYTGETVEVPSEWIVRVAEFKIRYEALEEEYAELEKLYKNTPP